MQAIQFKFVNKIYNISYNWISFWIKTSILSAQHHTQWTSCTVRMPIIIKYFTWFAPVGPIYSLGTHAPSIYSPDFGADLPTPFVEFIPGGRLLA